MDRADGMIVRDDGMVISSGDIRTVLSGALAAAGLESHGPVDAMDLPQARRYCVVLLDGLGAAQLEQRSGHFPFLRRLETSHITTVAPSTTAAAVTSFGTGSWPGLTGMLGYTVREPSGRLLNLIRWEDGTDAMDAWQTVPTLAQRLTEPQRFAVVAPGRFRGSGLTQAALRGARQIDADSLEDRVDATIKELRTGRADVVYLYWGEIDHVGHVNGWKSWEWGEEASHTDSELARLARELPAGTGFVVTADHGMIDVTSRIDATTTPLLAQGVDMIAGEPRASHLFTKEPDAVAERWHDVLEDSAWILTREETLGILGLVAPRFEPVVGDLMVFMRGTSVVVDSASQTPGSIALVGVHGSLTEEEMILPLITDVL